MESSVNITKALLKSTPMYLHRVQGGTQKQFNVVRLRFNNFFETSILYFTAKAENWHFTIVKNADFINVTVKADEYDKIQECCMFYDLDVMSQTLYGKKGSNRYSVEIPLEIIMNPENRFRKQGKLVLLFKLALITEAPLAVSPIIRTCNKKSLEYSKILAETSYRQYEEDMISASPKRTCTDFVIRVHKFKIHAHKAILASRSSFFNNYIGMNCENERVGHIKIDTTYKAMNAVVSFLYTGKTEVEPLKDMLEIFRLAVKLKLTILQLLCLRYLKESINEENVDQIKKTASRCGLSEVTSLVNAFMAKNKSAAKTAKKQSSRKSKVKKN